MKKILIIIAMIFFSSLVYAYGTFQGSFLSGTSKICKYSDGSVLTIGMSETCPLSN